MQDRLKFADYLCLFLVLVLALGARASYLHWLVDDGKAKPYWRVQGNQERPLPTKGQKLVDDDKSPELTKLVQNWQENIEFKGPAPLATEEEITAHVSPGYSWVVSLAGRVTPDDVLVVRWGQALLGGLTAFCYFLFARRAFGSLRVALVAGLFAALYPFWIISTAELQDGVLATFALSVVMMLGARGSQSGGVLTGLVFGLSLAGLVLVRAAFLPFSVIALLWYLLCCRKQRLGWLCALLACLGYATGLNTWIVRDYQAFGEPVPVVTSTFLHLWMGNCEQANGAEFNAQQLRLSLPAARYKELTEEKNQARRYNMLAQDVLEKVTADPKATCDRRIQATLAFLLGRSWAAENHPLAEFVNSADDPLDSLIDYQVQTLLVATLLLLFVLGFLGWRLSMAWRDQSRLAALAVFWVPLPYILSHAEMFSGPRLPLDGVLLCLAAYALVGFERKKKA